MPLARRLALALLWMAAPAEAALAARLGLGWEATLLAGLALAAGTSATAGMRRARADLALAAAMVPAAALAMGWLIAAGRPGLAVVPPLLAVALGFLLGGRIPFATVAAGALALAGLPLIAYGMGAEAGLRATLIAGGVMLATALRPPLPRSRLSRPPTRILGPVAPVLGGSRPIPPRPAEPGLMLRAERRPDGALALALATGTPPHGGWRVRVAPT